MRKLSTIAATAMIGFSSSLFAQEPTTDFQEAVRECPPCPAPVVADELYAIKGKKFVTMAIVSERPGWSPDWRKYDQHETGKPPLGYADRHTSRRYL